MVEKRRMTREPSMTAGMNGAAGVNVTPSSSWLICRAGNLLCALPIEQVIEIMRVLPIEAFSGAPDYVCGLSIIRGAPVPVVDIGLIIGSEAGERMRLVVFRSQTRLIALAVGEVLEISAIAADKLAQLPPLLGDTAPEAVSAIGARNTELLVFLRSSRLVPDNVLTRLDQGGVAA
jgi:purine-binding chemotaxis protein CheW